MDRTLQPAKRPSKRRRARNRTAWKLLSPHGQECPFCQHPIQEHICSSGQPHFYRPATSSEERSRSVKLYAHPFPDGSHILIRRITVAKQAELITAFCKTCAKAKNTDQVLCYQRTLAKGEVVGLKQLDQKPQTDQQNGQHSNEQPDMHWYPR